MTTTALILILSAVAIANFPTSFSKECDPNGEGGCNTYVKTSGGLKVNSDTMKYQRNSYDAKKSGGNVQGEAGGGASQKAGKTGSGYAAQSIGGKKNGKAAVAESEKKGKPVHQGLAGNNRVGQAGRPGSRQTQSIYAKQQGGKSYTGRSVYLDSNVDKAQTQILQKGGKKMNFAVNRTDSGVGQAVGDSPQKAMMTGIRKNSDTVRGTLVQKGQNPPRIDRKQIEGSYVEASQQSKAQYTGPTDIKFFKGRNTLISQQEEKGSISKTQISGRNALLGALVGNRAALGVTSEANEATNQVKTSSQIFGTNIDSGTNAKINSFKEVECSGDFVNKDDDNGGFKFYKLNEVKLTKQSDGSYKFPSCMDIDAKVRIAAGVDLRDVALSMSLLVPSCGQYRCGASRKCGPLECFYRRLCPEEIPRGDNFNDAGEFLVTSLTESNVCDIPIASSPRDVNIQFEYCPNQSADVDQPEFCNSGIFGRFGQLFGNDKKSSATIQLDMYTARDPFSCSNLSGSNFEKVACKKFHYDYTIQAVGKLPSVGRIDGGSSTVNCDGGYNSNHPDCQGLGK